MQFEFFQTHPLIANVLKFVLMAAGAAAVVILLLRFEKKAARRFLPGRTNINVRFAENIARFIIILIAVQWVIMSSPLTSSFGRVLFRGTAIVGAIAGLAAQPVISDLICGMIISFTKPFDIGDRIELDNGISGIVQDITLRHVVIKTIDTCQAVIPNSKLNSMMVTNMSYHTKTRSIHFRFNVSYGTNVEQAMKVIYQAVKESPYSIPGKPGKKGGEYGPVYFISYAESSLVMAVTVYFAPVTPSEVVKSDINTRVKKALDEAGIEIPYNYVNVVVNGSGESAGQNMTDKK